MLVTDKHELNRDLPTLGELDYEHEQRVGYNEMLDRRAAQVGVIACDTTGLAAHWGFIPYLGLSQNWRAACTECA